MFEIKLIKNEKRNIFLVLLAFIGNYSIARNLKGKVFCSGKGLSGVVVTDGINCTVTDKNGEYQLNTDSTSDFVEDVN